MSQARAALADAVSASRLEDSRNSSSISQTAADARGHTSTINKSSTSQAEADAHMHTSAISAALSAAGVQSAGRGEVARLNLLLSAAAINERQARAAAADASARASSAQQDARQARDSAQTAQRERDAMFERCQLLEFIVKQLPPAWVQHWLGDSEMTVPDLSPAVRHDIDLSLRALRGVALHASTDKCAALEARVAELSRRLADAMQPRLEEETRQEVERQAWAAEVSQLTDCLDTATALHTAKVCVC
ncbi:MAG: hypothetical protein EOO41_04070 [Methanobacteriota archaeon]|nr:MAG: hypothetical protein EOO41_04070 [Euryarchaeota archaeon]